ncbi:Inner membrane protein YabI [Hartmannibacter diazotrophicus]|uniref:Inner membrane protein YabI n=1 Tax=Hartmannibacter diazotrophicus TaxID=1482074 RepID=A0A2C9D5E5_9HYPH|nr:bifunctional DedA family/phosphatase PAP2 family protein [Hartmannibacter diazotrophicus]SON54971.1 Inner membrane protein YabI [Hartmannibacter diazotrophicus]
MFSDLISSVVEFLRLNPGFAYLAAFLLAFSESIPIVGAVVPGTATILALSALVPSGVLVFWPLLAATVLGAIAGDGLSFWLGHRYHRGVLGAWPFSRYPDLVRHSETFFDRHGDKSVFLARFIPGVRAFVPLLAGVLNMGVATFYTVNVASALVWAPVHVLSGMLVGTSVGMLGEAAKPLALLLVVTVIGLWVVVQVVRLTLRHVMPVLLLGAGHTRIWAEKQPGWLPRYLAAVLDPQQSDARVLAALILVLAAGAWTFFGILEDVVTGDPLVYADQAIYNIFQELRSGPGDSIMIAVTELGDTSVVVAMVLAVLGWLLWKGAWRTAGYWLAAIAGASMLNTAIKVALHRTRPIGDLYNGWSAFSFPSGHSTINFVLYGFLAFLLARFASGRMKIAIAFTAACFAFAIAFSRLYLGAHWFSDVAGGLAFGSAWLALLVLFYMRRPAERLPTAPFVAVCLLVLVGFGGFHVDRNHARDVERYAVRTAVPTMTLADWRGTRWQDLAVWRTDLTGEQEEPLTIQWAGDLEPLRTALLAEGWQPSPPWTVANALHWLTPGASPEGLPVVPLLSSGQPSGLALILPEPASSGARHVFRLWPANFNVIDGRKSPLWVGSVINEQLVAPLSLVTIPRMQPADRPMLASIETALAKAGITVERHSRPEGTNPVLLGFVP